MRYLPRWCKCRCVQLITNFMGIKNSYFDYRNTGLTDGDNGRYAVTKKESDRHKFKTPTLRNVMLTYPYMHDGTVASVEDAIRIMHEFQVGKEINRCRY